MTEKKTILAVGAHPDDIEFGCSVTVRNFIQNGYDAYYVVLTTGENGFKIPTKSKQERIRIRKREQRQAAQKTGVKKVYFLGYQDGFLEYSDTLRKKITMLIRKIKPEVLFSFDPANTNFDSVNLFHRDHRVAALATFDAVFAAKNRFIYNDNTQPEHRVSKIYFFGTNKPNLFVDISKNIDFKLDLLSLYKSQFPDFEQFANFFKENIIYHTAEYKYAEVFRVLEVVQIPSGELS
ncbi:MAG: PIG-L deacetylase family protein [Ignavibacteria bacterium]